MPERAFFNGKIMNISLDLETLNTAPNSVILSIGCVKFDPCNDVDPHSPFYHKLDVDSQLNMGRTVGDDTLEWWSKQPAAVFEEAMSDDGRVAVVDVMAGLNKYCVGVKYIYCQGTVFDIGLLDNLYRMHDRNLPWQYWQVMDTRLMYRMHGDMRIKQSNDHNALADAYKQAVAIQRTFSKLGITQCK